MQQCGLSDPVHSIDTPETCVTETINRVVGVCNHVQEIVSICSKLRSVPILCTQQEEPAVGTYHPIHVVDCTESALTNNDTNVEHMERRCCSMHELLERRKRFKFSGLTAICFSGP